MTDLRPSTADLTDITVVELRLLWRDLGLGFTCLPRLLYLPGVCGLGSLLLLLVVWSGCWIQCCIITCNKCRNITVCKETPWRNGSFSNLPMWKKFRTLHELGVLEKWMNVNKHNVETFNSSQIRGINHK